MNTHAARWDGSAATPVNSDPDTWYVALAPDKVKALSLQQLDDLFRLSIIDAETRVWQPGMTEWQPLGFVASMGAEPARLPPASSGPTAPVVAAPARRAPARVAPQMRALLAEFEQSPRRPPARAAPPGAGFQAYSAVTTPAAASPRPLTLGNPVIGSVSTPPRTSRGGSSGRFLLFTAFLVGIGLSSYRNGLLHEGARALGRERWLIDLETRLGVPEFGTVRAVEKEKVRVAALLPEAIAPLAAPSTEAPATSGRTEPGKAEADVAAAPVMANPPPVAPPRKEVPMAAAPVMANPPPAAPPRKEVPMAAAPVMANPPPAAPPRKEVPMAAAAPPRKEAPVVAVESPKKESAARPSSAAVGATPALPTPKALERGSNAAAPAVTSSAPARAQSAPKAAPVVEESENEMSPKERLDAAIRRSVTQAGKSK